MEKHWAYGLFCIEDTAASAVYRASEVEARIAELEQQLTMANDAAAKGELARQTAAGMQEELDLMNLAVGYFHEENDRFITRIAELEQCVRDGITWCDDTIEPEILARMKKALGL